MLNISCDDCAMQCTSVCSDCVVTFVLRSDHSAADQPLELDVQAERIVRLFTKAGLIPELQFRRAG